MTWIATENFDSYTIGNDMNTLNGGSGWTGAWTSTGAGEGVIVAAPSGMTTNAAEMLWITGDGGDAQRSLSLLTDGIVSFQMRAAQTDRLARFTLAESGVGSKAYIRFDSDGNIKAVGSASNTLQAYSANTTYRILIKFGHTAGNFAVSIDGGAYSADFDMSGTGSNVNLVTLVNENVTTSSFFFDDIKSGATVVNSSAFLAFM